MTELNMGVLAAFEWWLSVTNAESQFISVRYFAVILPDFTV